MWHPAAPVGDRPHERMALPGGGAGAGSIVRWLEQRVGPSGKVVALDTDPRFLRGSGSSTIEILQGDICDTDLPLATFDLVHARYVMIHIAEYQRAFERMLRCVKPEGGSCSRSLIFQAARAVAGSEEGRASFESVSEAIERMFSSLRNGSCVGGEAASIVPASRFDAAHRRA